MIVVVRQILPLKHLHLASMQVNYSAGAVSEATSRDRSRDRGSKKLMHILPLAGQWPMC